MTTAGELVARWNDPAQPPVVIAELSGNHGGRLTQAEELTRAAVASGADACKLQTYRPQDLTLPFQTETFRIHGGLWDGRYLWDLYEEAQTPWEWTGRLAKIAAGADRWFFSTPFSPDAVSFLEQAIDPPAHKIASFELNHVPLLRAIGRTGKPVIASTGMASEEEIRFALGTLREAGSGPVALLVCVSAYPAEPTSFHLRKLETLREKFDVVVGLSDHSLSDTIAIAATALGARIIEKHLVLARDSQAVDAGFSLEPHEFARLVEAVRTAHAALGSPELKPASSEAHETKFRRSLFAARNIARGETFTEKNLAIVRPGSGLPPHLWDQVLGATAATDLHAGQPLRAENLSMPARVARESA